MFESMRQEKKEPSLPRRCVRFLGVPENAPMWSLYPIGLYILYIAFVISYPFVKGNFWQAINNASIIGTVVFGIMLIGAEEWIARVKPAEVSRGPAIGILAFVAAVLFPVLFVSFHGIWAHLVLLFIFSLALAGLDLALYRRFLAVNATETQITRRRLLLFGVDLPLATGLAVLLTLGAWPLTHFSNDNLIIEAFLTGALALELALTNAAATFLIAFAREIEEEPLAGHGVPDARPTS